MIIYSVMVVVVVRDQFGEDYLKRGSSSKHSPQLVIQIPMHWLLFIDVCWGRPGEIHFHIEKTDTRSSFRVWDLIGLKKKVLEYAKCYFGRNHYLFDATFENLQSKR